MENWLIVIPARLKSTRLPEKPLQDLGGQPLIVRVCQNLTVLEDLGAQLLVATDSLMVKRACESAGFSAVMTSESHQSGTDRVWEASQHSTRPFVMNVQGDEPFVSTMDLERLAKRVEETKAPMGTLGFRSSSLDQFMNHNVVKIAVADDSRALYFSRAPIPHLARQSQLNQPGIAPPQFWHHQGVYAFTKEALKQFCALPQGTLERIESLEQLRALEHGMAIIVVPADHAGTGIDTPDDLEVARARFLKI